MRAWWWGAGFLVWTAGVVTGVLDRFDATLTWRADGAALDFWRSWTHIGDTVVLAAATVAFAALLAIEGRRRAGLWLGATVFAAMLAVAGLKALVARPRPAGALDAGFSFPSGHTTVSVVALVLAAVAFGLPRGPRIAVWALALSLGISRVALGVHYPSDIVGGWLLATTVVLVAARTVAPSAK